MTRGEAINNLKRVGERLDMTYAIEQEKEELEAINMGIEALKKYRESDFHADWQPIEDGNPSPGQYYITWDGKVNEAGHYRRYIEIAEFYLEDEWDKDSGRWDLSHIEKRNFLDVRVVAWMNLPDKYEGDLE